MVVDIARPDDAGSIDLMFHAFADSTRRDIIRLVLQQEHSVTDLARRYPMSFAAVQKHVAVLERAALVTKHQRGRERMVRGRIETVHEVSRLLDQLETVWRDRMHRFGEVLADLDQPDHPSNPTKETDRDRD